MKAHQRPGFIPPYQDLETLAAHVCMGTSTIEDHIRRGMFPPHSKMQGGKKFWSWKIVERHMDGEDKEAPLSPGQQLEDITNAVRNEVSRAKNHA